MKIIDPGHEYIIEALDGGEPQTMRFVKRVGINYPGNTDAYGGPITQEYLRAIIHRCVYIQSQRSCAETAVIINSLRTALLAFEVRAARCRGAAIELPTLEGIEEIPTCPICGHIQCDQTRHAKPHWSTEIGPRILPPDAQPAPERWQPITTAPRDGTKVLLAKIVGHIDHPTAIWWVVQGFWSDKWHNWNDGIEPSGLAGPTYWMPVPRALAAPAQPQDERTGE